MNPAASNRLILTLICNEPRLAAAAIAGGVDRVLVDLERLGKQERQKGKGLFLSAHDWRDVETLRNVLPRGALFVRLDPLHDGSGEQVERAIAMQADGLMLPYFHHAETVFLFCQIVASRCTVVPLVETKSAVGELDRLLAAHVVGEFHIGLNDLALDLGFDSLNRLWRHPILDAVANVARQHHAEFGIGGVTDPRTTDLPVDPRFVIAEQKRLGSTRALLGRNFRAAHEEAPNSARIRDAVEAIQAAYRSQD